MARPFAGIVAGLIAGAAGATALNAVTYLDQAVRGRPGGDTPAKTVEAISDVTNIDVPGDGDTAENRLQGLGPLAGLGVGVGVGALSGLLRIYWVKVPKPLSAVIVGLGAMAISDTTMAALKVSDPKEWTAETVVSDVVPHLAYGLVTTAALHRLLDPRTPHAL